MKSLAWGLALMGACSSPSAWAALDCSSPVAVVDFGTVSATTVSGDTSAGAALAAVYSCSPAIPQDGPEQVVAVVVNRPGHLFVVQESGLGALALFVTSACDESACIATGDRLACAPDLTPGTYFVVVDSVGPSGPYELTLAFEDSFQRWSACQDPVPPTLPTDTQSDHWHFTDGAYCFSDAASRNFPAGCDFALYVNVRCGTELHLVFDDVESATVFVYDVLAGEYVTIAATSSMGPVTPVGPGVTWQDCAAAAPDVDDRVTDVHFEAPDALCGVYRVELLGVSGWDWDIVANCTADPTPGFTIFDSACAAFQAWSPLPSVSLGPVTHLYNCPDFSVRYEVRNTGCIAAESFEVVILDGGSRVATDVVPAIPAGGVLTRTIVGVFPVVPTTGAVVLELDPDNLVTECEEVLGAACGSSPGQEVAFLPPCDGSCTVAPSAQAQPAVACEGAVVSIDASASVVNGCPGGTLEYALLVNGQPFPPIWGPSPAFPVTVEQATYEVGVRCLSLGNTCGAFVDVPLTVHSRPVLDPASVTAADVNGCVPGIRLTWAAATFPSGSGTYSIHRSEVSCADAVALAPPGPCLAGTSFDDVSTSVGVTYFYVVAAEDGLAGSACTLGGPCVGGAVTRVDANGGSCVGITDGVGLQPSATAAPDRLCVGSTFAVDASASSSSTCPGGTLQYQVVGPNGVVAPWQDAPTFAAITAEAGAYAIQTRCMLQTSCVGTSPLALVVDSPPTFDPAAVLAADISPCLEGIRLTWSPATFPSGTGRYSIQKSDVSCDEAKLNLPIQCTNQTSWDDFTTTPGSPQFYVVTAEDDDPSTTCAALGRCVLGASTSVDASGGTCSATIDVVVTIAAAAVATPDRGCAGDPITVDASGSIATGCPGGTLEYQLVGPAGVAVAWQGDDVFPPVPVDGRTNTCCIASPGGCNDPSCRAAVCAVDSFCCGVSWDNLCALEAATTCGCQTYRVEVRCATEPECVDSTPVVLTVEAPPVLDAPSFTAVDTDPCLTGIELTWSPASFQSGSGTYTIYRSTVSCADALGLPRIATCLTLPSKVDTTTIPGGTYFYVLEAEDGTQALACSPVGPCRRGESVRVDANGGTCVGIVDVAIVDPAPVFDPSSVVAVDMDPCSLGILISWDAATFPSGSGSYSIYRSSVSCADAAASGIPYAGCLTGTSFQDSATPDGPYFYVVVAENDGVAGCPPFGPCHDGAITSVDANGGTCAGIDDAALVELQPTLDPPSVVAADLASCGTGIGLTWAAATFPDGSGTYAIYRSTTSCAVATSLPAVASCLTQTSWDDITTVAGETYHYVVEAENSVPGTCVQPGDCVGGTITQVAANGGSCTGILDVATTTPDLLPRVGASLRLGGVDIGGLPAYGPTFVTLQWTTDRALDVPAGEHFHVLRSEAPDSGFALIVPEPPRLVTGLFTDAAAVHPFTPHVFHYLVITANDCEQDNLAFDTLP